MEIIYRADDGTEFRNQTDCLLHERMSNLSHNILAREPMTLVIGVNGVYKIFIDTL